jgi:CRP/FNR family transcriptional regulator, cyclic AMP receptor protein
VIREMPIAKAYASTPQARRSPTSPADVARIFTKSPLFEGLQPISGSTVVTVDRRRALYGQATRADAVLLVASGRARLIKTAPDRTTTMAYRGPGELTGEESLFSDSYDCEARALDRLEAVRIPVEQFRARLDKDAVLAGRLLRLVQERRASAERRFEAAFTRSVEARVAAFLVEAAVRWGIKHELGTLVGVKLTHLEIASYVGSTRETVTVILGELKRRHLIETGHRRIIVRDREALLRLSV